MTPRESSEATMNGWVELMAKLPMRQVPPTARWRIVAVDGWQTKLIKRHNLINLQVWRNWQTRMVQVHVRATSCRFKSCYLHQKRSVILIQSYASFSLPETTVFKGFTQKEKFYSELYSRKKDSFYY